jgi:glucosamine-phosphate N-acetyltransferase
MENLKINKTKEEDFEGVFYLLTQLWPDKKLNKEKIRKLFVARLLDKRHEQLVAVHQEEIVGFISLTILNSLWQEGFVGHIDELIVKEAFRRKNIASRLLNGISQIAKERLCKKIELDSSYHREAAHKFYSSKGFKDRALVFSVDL